MICSEYCASSTSLIDRSTRLKEALLGYKSLFLGYKRPKRFFGTQKSFFGIQKFFFGIQNAFFRDTKKLFLTFSEVQGPHQLFELFLTFWKVRSGKGGVQRSATQKATGKQQHKQQEPHKQKQVAQTKKNTKQQQHMKNSTKSTPRKVSCIFKKFFVSQKKFFVSQKKYFVSPKKFLYPNKSFTVFLLNADPSFVELIVPHCRRALSRSGGTFPLSSSLSQARLLSARDLQHLTWRLRCCLVEVCIIASGDWAPVCSRSGFDMFWTLLRVIVWTICTYHDGRNDYQNNS